RQWRADRALEVGQRILELRSGIDRSKPDIAGRLKRLQQRDDARLTELIAVLCDLLDLLGQRKDLVPVAQEELASCLGEEGGRGDQRIDARQRCLALGAQLIQRTLFQLHSGAMSREERNR